MSKKLVFLDKGDFVVLEVNRGEGNPPPMTFWYPSPMKWKISYVWHTKGILSQ